MNDSAERIRQQLASAHSEALRVGDSPLRADALARTIEAIRGRASQADLGDEQTSRITYALESALRVLRRDDDGREAAKHIQTALGQFEAPPPRPSPFLDD